MRSSGVSRAVLLIVLFALAGFAYGFLSAETGLPPYTQAHRAYEWAQRRHVFYRIRDLLTGRRNEPLPEGSWQSLDNANWYAGQGEDGPGGDFSGVGYLSGYKPAGDLKGVSVLKSACTQPGVNLVTSGHAPEASLMDMEGKVLLYIHGGGFISGSCQTHRVHVAKFALGCRLKSLLFDYRLAPEHPFPAALEDCVAAYRWLLEEGYTPDDVIVGGESAGGTLTLSLLERSST